MPDVSEEDAAALLEQRRYVVCKGRREPGKLGWRES